MTTFDALLGIARHSMDLAIWLWPVSIVLGAAAIGALVLGYRLGSAPIRGKWPLVLVGYIMPVVVIAIGAVFRYDGPPPPQWVEPPEWRGALLWVVLGANVLTVISVGLFTQGARIRATLVALPSIWLTSSSAFVAAMAIVGRGL